MSRGPGQRWEDELPSWKDAWMHGPHLVIFILAMVLLMSVGGVFIYRAVAPQQEAARREVYEQTKSYVDGTVRDLENLRLEYLRAKTDAHRSALRSTILHRAVDFPEDRLPDDLRQFIAELKTQEEGK